MKKHIMLIAWGLSTLAVLLAVVSWQQYLVVPLGQSTIYDIFPVFGLVAFSIMWSHYAVGALVRWYDISREKVDSFYRWTAYVVLAAILLHPGLLEWQFWRDSGELLPYGYVAPSLRLYIVLAQVALVAFLAYESHRWFKERSWWHWVERASDVAMFLILIHAYKLGLSLLPGWFRYVWFFYGVTLIIAIGYAAHVRHNKTGKWL
jgi:hypothetical protein